MEKEQKAGESSRTIELETHYTEGTVPFPPFFMLRTMGCLARSWKDVEGKGVMSTTNRSEYGSEYESMIRYSRPLFAKLHKII